MDNISEILSCVWYKECNVSIFLLCATDNNPIEDLSDLNLRTMKSKQEEQPNRKQQI